MAILFLLMASVLALLATLLWYDYQKNHPMKVLRALSTTEWAGGLELVNRYGFSRGTVYVVLERLERDGFIESRSDGALKRVYRRRPTGRPS